MNSEEIIKLREEKSKKGFMKLGYGTVAYFYFHEFMIWMLIAICAISIPSMIFFTSYKNGDRDITHNSLYKFGIANLGFAKAYCWDTNMNSWFLRLECQTGEIRQIYSFGIIPSDGHILDACEPNNETRKCDDAFDRTRLRNFI